MLGRVSRVMMPWRKPRPVVAAVRLAGVISPGGRLGSSGLSIAAYAAVIEAAFAAPGLKAVALILNSPGGSPVQSHLLFKRVRALSAEKHVPVFAFVEDVAASGGYILACAGDEIFADESSIVGSIGVVSAGFGLTGLIEKLGVERRVHTSGAHKAMLDPFQPERADDVARLTALQREIHEWFIALVKERRGERLKGAPDELFSGEFWTGQRGLELGLIDGIGDAKSILKARFGDKVRIKAFAPSRGMFGLGPAKGSATHRPGLFEEGLAFVEERLLWDRFGL